MKQAPSGVPGLQFHADTPGVPFLRLSHKKARRRKKRTHLPFALSISKELNQNGVGLHLAKCTYTSKGRNWICPLLPTPLIWGRAEWTWSLNPSEGFIYPCTDATHVFRVFRPLEIQNPQLFLSFQLGDQVSFGNEKTCSQGENREHHILVDYMPRRTSPDFNPDPRYATGLQGKWCDFSRSF